MVYWILERFELDYLRPSYIPYARRELSLSIRLISHVIMVGYSKGTKFNTAVIKKNVLTPRFKENEFYSEGAFDLFCCIRW